MKMIIPIIIQPSTENYFWVKNVLEGIKSRAVRYDCELLIFDKEMFQKQNLPHNVPVLVNGHLSEWLSGTAMFLQVRGYAPIIINASFVSPERCKYSSVRFDIASGIQEVVDYCKATERKKIVLLGVRKNIAGDEEKVRLFQQNLEKSELADAQIIYMEDTLGKCVREFVDYFFDNNIDAVICANDTVAVFLIREFQNNNIRIPEDVLVIGVGNSMVGRLSNASLVSLTADYVEMGKQAVSLWRYLYKEGTDADITISINCRMNRKYIGSEFVTQQYYQEDFREEADSCEDSWNDYFYEDEDVKRMHQLEMLLQGCDETDLALLQAIKQEKTDETIAQEIWLTSRAVRYRINKMVKKLGVHNRNELVMMLREFNIGGDAG